MTNKHYSLYLMFGGEPRPYLKEDGSVWKGTEEQALRLRYNLARTGQPIAHIREED
jgi:hypothetical protein